MNAMTRHILAATWVVAATVARADDLPVTASPPSDKSNYMSDRIKYQFARSVRVVDMTAPQRVATPACLPAFTTMRGIGTLDVDGQTQPAFIVTAVATDPAKRCRDNPVVSQGDVVVVEPDELVGTPPDRYGLTYGTLMVPFKYHMRGEKRFSAGASVGGYMGFRQDRSGKTGLATQYIVFLGATSVAVPQTVDGSTTTQNMAGVSYGIGMLGTLKDSFQMGLVLGADRVNSSAGYKDNGKPWLAVSLGYSFSN